MNSLNFKSDKWMSLLFICTVFSLLLLSWQASKWTHPHYCFDSLLISKIVYLSKNKKVESLDSCETVNYWDLSRVRVVSQALQKVVKQVEALENLEWMRESISPQVLFVDGVNPKKVHYFEKGLILGESLRSQIRRFLVISLLDLGKESVDVENSNYWSIDFILLALNMGGPYYKNKTFYNEDQVHALALMDFYKKLSLKKKKEFLDRFIFYFQNQKEKNYNFFKWSEEVAQKEDEKRDFKKVMKKWTLDLNSVSLLVDLNVEDSEFILNKIKTKNVHKDVVFVDKNHVFSLKHKQKQKAEATIESESRLVFYCDFPSLSSILNEKESLKKLYVVKACNKKQLKNLKWNVLVQEGVRSFLKNHKDLNYMSFHIPSLKLASRTKSIKSMSDKSVDVIDFNQWKDLLGWQETKWQPKSFSYSPLAVYEGVMSYRL